MPRRAKVEQQENESKKSKRFLQCPFCGEIHYSLNGKDPTSSWCTKCGKCFPAIWKEE